MCVYHDFVLALKQYFSAILVVLFFAVYTWTTFGPLGHVL